MIAGVVVYSAKEMVSL